MPSQSASNGIAIRLRPQNHRRPVVGETGEHILRAVYPVPVSVWILVGMSPHRIGSPVCEQGGDSGFVDVPGLLVKDDTGYLVTEEEGIDIEVLSLELVPRSLAKSGFWTDSWLTEDLLALLQVPADSGLRSNRGHCQAGHCRH